jgi:hypothetical protein
MRIGPPRRGSQAQSPYFPPQLATPSSSSSSLSKLWLLPPARSAPLIMPEEEARSSGGGRLPDGDGDSGFECDDDILMDPAFLEEIERVEQAAHAEAPLPHNAAPTNVIVIDSDSEHGDKENVPLPLRRVRRRTGDTEPQEAREASMEDVIEIASDVE